VRVAGENDPCVNTGGGSEGERPRAEGGANSTPALYERTCASTDAFMTPCGGPVVVEPPVRGVQGQPRALLPTLPGHGAQMDTKGPQSILVNLQTDKDSQ
jgi:hypothetical protein